MSILYILFIEHPWIDGNFMLGRFVDLAQMDTLIAILWFSNWRRWRRLKAKDEEER